ncbi:MAG: hypothetical protein KHW59_02520 [Clostridiales bacterium]|nr:hypothetical protein [Clostridiales bacterium]
MTREEQIKMANELYEVDIAMETASELLWIVMDEHFDKITCPDHFETYYARIQTKLRAAHEFLYQACLRMDFLTGEKTDITEAHKRNFAELTSYPMYE